MSEASGLELLPGSSLELYVKNSFELKDQSEVNGNTGDPGLVHVLFMGTADVVISGQSTLVGHVAASDARLKIEGVSHVFGTFLGQEIEMKDGSGFHLDKHPPPLIHIARWVQQP